jgi:MFS superfamily sulfate permease-like transporter
MKMIELPKDGLQGLKQNWSTDALSGFLVFLLALPLSLGIAKASGFPASAGVLTAIVGGLVVSFFAGSPLTIKGPAAGLITVCSGAISDLGSLNPNEANGLQLACGAVFIMSLLQIALGYFKFGSLSDFFPPSAVHGMLAAIGLIIFSKQIHVLLGIDPSLLKDLNTVELFTLIPYSFTHADSRVTLVGLISLAIIFGMPLLKNAFVKKIPPPLAVIVVTIPLALVMDFKHTEPAFDLVQIGDFWTGVSFYPSFAAIDTFVFWKYVAMFLLINSLETLLTVKAIDGLDRFRRESNTNKDLSAVGIGNAVAAIVGGLPMISEVARSSANVSFGAKTKWSNFFHGLFLLVAMLVLIPVIELIPNSALAALLISVGYKLASPREFYKSYKIGVEQLVVFVVTIVATLATDLLIGIGVGVAIKLMFHVLNGAPLRSLFKPRYELVNNETECLIDIKDAAIFSNLVGYKKLFKKLEIGRKIVFNFSEARIVDHSFMEQFHQFEERCLEKGGLVVALGFDHFRFMSNHPLATRKFSSDLQNRIEFRLSPRQIAFRKFADQNEYSFYPQPIRAGKKFSQFFIQQEGRIELEENLLVKYSTIGKIEVSDILLTQGVREEKRETQMTLMQFSEHDLMIPDFTLEPEGLWTQLFERVAGEDIDFNSYPIFSKKYYLRSLQKQEIATFFNSRLIDFLEQEEEMHIECHKNRLVFFKKRDLMETADIARLEQFAERFLSHAQAN